MIESVVNNDNNYPELVLCKYKDKNSCDNKTNPSTKTRHWCKYKDKDTNIITRQRQFWWWWWPWCRGVPPPPPSGCQGGGQAAPDRCFAVISSIIDIAITCENSNRSESCKSVSQNFFQFNYNAWKLRPEHLLSHMISDQIFKNFPPSRILHLDWEVSSLHPCAS